ncbi:MAG: hypothetical protein ACI4EA_06045 [Candidatus Ornithomonoglobus sp.]
MKYVDLLDGIQGCILELADALADLARLVKEYNRISLSDTAEKFMRKKQIYKKKADKKYKIISENVAVIHSNITEAARGPPQAAPKLISSYGKGGYTHMSENLKNKIAEGSVVAFVVIAILALLYGISWIVTCGIIKLITMCFGWTFKWSIATGIWLIICILRSIFNVTVENK